MSFTWVQWFQSLYQRVGGGSTDPLNQVNARIDALNTRVTNAEASITVLNGDVSTINGEISVLQTDVADLETRVGAIEAQLAAGFSGTITTAALSPLGSQGSMAFSNGILTGQVQAT
jgi:uncharacterized coiled-coil protein SlyX